MLLFRAIWMTTLGSTMSLLLNNLIAFITLNDLIHKPNCTGITAYQRTVNCLKIAPTDSKLGATLYRKSVILHFNVFNMKHWSATQKLKCWTVLIRNSTLGTFNPAFSTHFVSPSRDPVANRIFTPICHSFLCLIPFPLKVLSRPAVPYPPESLSWPWSRFGGAKVDHRF